MERTDNPIKIRVAGVNDLSWLFAFCREQSFEEYSIWGADFVYQFPPLLEQMKESFLNREHTVLLKGENDGRVVAFAEITEIDTERNCGVLARVLLDKNQRGKGIGKSFVKKICEFAEEELKLSKISLIVYESNVRARACYEACGFLVTEPLIREGRPDALRMEISL